MTQKQKKIDRQIAWTLWTLGIAFLVGEITAGIAVGLRNHDPSTALVAAVWGAAFIVIGFSVGFLFGVPRAAAPDAADQSHLKVNTNLEQISDWLTKVITGAALANLREVPGSIKLGGEYVARGIAGCSGPCQAANDLSSIGGAIFCFFLALGFLFGYLATRTFFTRLFSETDPGFQETAESLPPVGKDSLVAAPVRFDQPLPTLDTSAAKAVSALQALPVTTDLNADALLLMGKAKLYSGKWGEAVQAYNMAVDQQPNNPNLRLELAYALHRTSHDPLEAQNQLDRAVSLVKTSGDKDLTKRVYEGAVCNALYLAPPDGFEKAIRLGEEFTKDGSNLVSAAIWANLAAAYGQKVRWLKANKPDQDTKSLRDLALEAVKNAISNDVSSKNKLGALMNPSQEGGARGENDLEVFKDDAEFQKILG